jgi:ribose transport system substrate-binding protein
MRPDDAYVALPARGKRLRMIFAIALLFGLAACGHSSRKVIGVVSKGQAHEFWQSIHAGAVKAGRDFNVDIRWNGPAEETDYARQIQIVESMIAQHVDALALAPVERQSLVQPVNRALQAGIPVTIYDSALDSDRFTSFVATNNYAAGESAARKLGELLGGKGQVIVLRHMPGSASSTERESAFDAVMSKEFAGITIAGWQYGMADSARVRAAAENLLSAHPAVSGMFASAESSSVGAALALKARGLAGKVKLVAFDSSPALIDDLRDGSIDALVAQDPFRIGYEAVKTLAEKLNGQVPPKKIDLGARVITRNDLDRPDVKAILFPDLKKYL